MRTSPQASTSRGAQNALVICVPQVANRRDSYALSIVKDYVKPEQEILRAPFPTDDADGASQVWRDASERIAQELLNGDDVAFITEGDPMLFSTFSYVLDGIKSGYPEIRVEIIPGVSSVMAAAARTGLPLVTHGQRLAILPAVYGIDDLREAIANYDTIVLMKVNKVLLDALVNLEKLGLAGKGVYVRRATTDQEQVVNDLQQLSASDLDYFSLLIIRKGD